MGRQYNYFISPEEDIYFTKYLFENGFLIVAPTISKGDEGINYDWSIDKIHIYNDINLCENEYSLFKRTFVYKEDWGELIKMSNDNLDYFKGPLIERFHCRMNLENNVLARGRLYLNTYYKDEMEAYDKIYKAYEKLVRLMKKNIAYKSYHFEDGRKLDCPASQKAIDVLKKGYRIGD